MQIFSNDGWSGGRCEPHAPPRPSPIPVTSTLFVVLCNRFSRVGGKKKKTTQEKMSFCLCKCELFHLHAIRPSRKMSTITCWHIPQNTAFTCSILVTNTRHTREAYPPWSGMAGREERGLPAHGITGQWSNTPGQRGLAHDCRNVQALQTHILRCSSLLFVGTVSQNIPHIFAL